MRGNTYKIKDPFTRHMMFISAHITAMLFLKCLCTTIQEVLLDQLD